MEAIFEGSVAFITLTVMEIVLGIDNIVFIAVVTAKLPLPQQPSARRLGLGLALISRILLLFTLSWILGLSEPLFELLQIPGLAEFGPTARWLHENEEVNAVSVRDLILLAGGLFLLGKSVLEIHEKLNEEDEAEAGVRPRQMSFSGALVQIAILDMVFSLDSVITAVGMANHIPVMVGAVIVAVIVMLIFAEPVSHFVERHPTVKVLALSFLILIGVMLIAEGVGSHFNKGYIYFAMAFAVMVELINLRLRTASERRKKSKS